jgi:hypothetical protein
MYYTNLLKNRANSKTPLLTKQNTETWVIKYSVALLSWIILAGIPVNKQLNLNREFVPTGCDHH